MQRYIKNNEYFYVCLHINICYIEMIPPKIEQSSKEERREYV